MKRATFFIAVLAVARATSSNCIVGCNCPEDVLIARNLAIIDCDNPLNITKLTFSEISNSIVTISLKHVNIVNIEKDAFSGFDFLENAVIEDSFIGNIEPTAFDLPELGKISFTRTTFGKVPAFDTDYLEELRFIDCKLTEVPNLNKVPALQILDLSDNEITEIDESAFLSLDSLAELTLSNNSISKFPPNVFNNNSDLTLLNLDKNPLQSFRLSTPSSLESLSLKSSKITVFDSQSAQNLDLLTCLDLSHNQIKSLPADAFKGMEELTSIDLSNNALVEIDDKIFVDNDKLGRIILDNNSFNKLPNFQTDPVKVLFRTYYFSCNNCGLKFLDETFKNMPGIVTLNLANNKLTNIDGALTEILSLKQLDLSNNSIKSLGANALSKEMSLELLNLSGNPLKPLDPVVFENMNSLKKLYVSNTGLSQLWANHNAEIPSLERLYVGNNIITLTVDDLKVTKNLKLIDLQDNPLYCNKNFHDVIEWLTNHTVYPSEGADTLKTHEALKSIDVDVISKINFDSNSSWQKLAAEVCNKKVIIVNDANGNNNDDYYDEDSYTDDADTTESIDGENLDDDISVDKVLYNPEFATSNFAKATYILSLTSVFVLSALVVLTVAVAVFLIILRRNKAFNMQNGNLPRLKIPMWQSELKQKKHSGSIYKPLSEDLSGPKTPIINRYNFPSIHTNSVP